ncbi:tRNA nucleotidyltransferase [Thermoplasma volcanium GSS1]|uniref:CCA-adding enzyme n=1 Tax=Thermoplasma volcanium (strain ATCC 51530 / DSM 4299 / JCM 9571 / NBRC 15438 / GSS1) TaxID=273116 RepID=CCA_THEVO|nr:CCA tRNA nucleotidyltransferase [Thermoplasma volcanium]Q97CI4.1 RecName: Full=CCA-adding enzyme; AltName: Full=CCA tRNA nucleotidyltransferase; AltName: Full=tRNA CCA-pyrophosphorylase; AltName: Full=tRNA adenylyl-/cytidylyl- transferase; AltName: Full=tRNA nucleotidyltransferase; AltName: Full=tRNA-NT [Thermoplasma volcanium GSS1]BAB59259.1 tRNA nucleotidyltransferase [Thermoplasma volcanium GSS1]
MIDYSAILNRYRPDEQELQKLKSISEYLTTRASEICRHKNIRADPVLVGSYAKGTNLKDGDLDLFIAFDRDYEEKIMEKLGLSIGHDLLPNGKEKYAEHPYVSGEIDGIKIDVVPCFKMEFGQKKISAVDRTLLHTRYVNEKLDGASKDQVRLLKVFMKSVGVYGAEARTYGFSGYLCELLIIRYGNFENVLRLFSTTRGRLKIDDDERFEDPMVLIDPVDPDRNVASAVSLESLSRMRIASKMFLDNPSESFFDLERKPIKPKYHDRGTCIRIYSIEKPDLTDDVLYPQIYKFKLALLRLMEEYNMEPVGSAIDVADRIYVLIETRKFISDSIRIHVGPPADTSNSIDFIKKWLTRERSRGPYLVGNRLYVDTVEERKTPEEIVLSNISKYSIGKNLDKLKNTIKVQKFEEIKGRIRVLDRFFSEEAFGGLNSLSA